MVPAHRSHINLPVEERPLALVLHQFDRRQKPLATNFANKRMVSKAGHGLLEIGSDIVVDALHQPLTLDDLEVFQRYRAGNRMARPREPVHEFLVGRGEGIAHPLAKRDRRNRLVAR